MSAISGAISPSKHRRVAVAAGSKSFTPYLPGFAVAIIKDCLDVALLILLPIPGGAAVAVILDFVFTVGFGVLAATLILLFTSSKASFLSRLLAFITFQTADIIPGVGLLPLMSFSVIRVYLVDRKAELENRGTYAIEA